VGGDEFTMAKIFMVSVTGIARTRYTTLDTGRIHSWEQLRELMLENFQGNYDDLVTLGHLFAVKQRVHETIQSFSTTL
jgi:hypothetical protein